MNKIILKGNLTKNPEVKKGEKKSFLVFSIAVSDYMQDSTSYFNCLAFGKTAEFINKYFKKGMPILIEGRVKIDYISETKSSYTKVLVENVEFAGNLNEKKEDKKRKSF